MESLQSFNKQVFSTIIRGCTNRHSESVNLRTTTVLHNCQTSYRNTPENLELVVAQLPSSGHSVLVVSDTFLAKQVQLQSLMEQHPNLGNILQASYYQ